jgi:hypothetical protein
MTIKKSELLLNFMMGFFTLAPPSLFKIGPAVTAPLNGQTVKSNDDESFSLKKPSVMHHIEGLVQLDFIT